MICPRCGGHMRLVTEPHYVNGTGVKPMDTFWKCWSCSRRETEKKDG